MSIRCAFCAAAAAALLEIGVVSAAAAAPAYTLVGSFTLPAQTDAFDVLPDGRVVAIRRSGEIAAQTSVNGSGFARAGSINPALVSSFGAGFLRVSPDGSTLAIGDNRFPAPDQKVFFVASASLNPAADSPATGVIAPNAEAVWRDNSTLYVTGATAFGADSFVTAVNVPTLTARTVVANINGASAGVAVRGGWLFTGNGFENGPGGSRTGEIRAIPLTAADAAAAGGSAVDFEAAGTPVGRTLSASTLGFDSLGNLLVGGGDFFDADFGYAAAIDAASVLGALAGGPPATAGGIARLTPGSTSDFYGIRFNPATNEALVYAFGGSTVWRYTIPGPGSAAVAGALGLLAARRRRR
ncbi:MAG: hypothetical protein IBJ11_01885 [Phycisphaerales bacterium]|nr:hypothetical protein [Phycisphaerales bacterium]